MLVASMTKSSEARLLATCRSKQADKGACLMGLLGSKTESKLNE